MAEAKPVQPLADRAAMHRNAMDQSHLRDDLVQSKVTLRRKPVTQPAVVAGKFALSMVALNLRPQAPVSRLRITMSFTKRGDTRKCRAASRCP